MASAIQDWVADCLELRGRDRQSPDLARAESPIRSRDSADW